VVAEPLGRRLGGTESAERDPRSDLGCPGMAELPLEFCFAASRRVEVRFEGCRGLVEERHEGLFQCVVSEIVPGVSAVSLLTEQR